MHRSPYLRSGPCWSLLLWKLNCLQKISLHLAQHQKQRFDYVDFAIMGGYPSIPIWCWGRFFRWYYRILRAASGKRNQLRSSICPTKRAKEEQMRNHIFCVLKNWELNIKRAAFFNLNKNNIHMWRAQTYCALLDQNNQMIYLRGNRNHVQ